MLCETLRLCVRHKRNSVYFREFCVRRLMARHRHTQNFIAHAKAQRARSVMCLCSSVQSKLHTELTELHRNFSSHVLRMSAPSAWDNYPRRMGFVCSVDSVWKNLSRRRRRPTQTLRNFAPLREKICSYVLLSKKPRSSAKRVSQRKQREAFLPPYHTLKTNRRLIQFNMELN